MTILVDTDSRWIDRTIQDRIVSGTYEADEVSMMQSWFRRSLPAIDIGAGIGYTAMVAEALTDQRVLAVEPNPYVCPLIESTKEMNGGTFEIIQRAYDPDDDKVTLNIDGSFWATSAYRSSNTVDRATVGGMSLRTLLDDHDVDGPVQILFDTEGAEDALVRGEADVLAERCAVLVIELHPFAPQFPAVYVSQLEQVGFDMVDRSNSVYVLVNDDAV